MADQAEELRKRLEARGIKAPDPVLDDHAPLPDPFRQDIAPPVMSHAASATVDGRKLENAVHDISRAQPVVVVDVKIKFWSMVVLMTKMVLAALPAFILANLIIFGLFVALGGWGALVSLLIGRGVSH